MFTISVINICHRPSADPQRGGLPSQTGAGMMDIGYLNSARPFFFFFFFLTHCSSMQNEELTRVAAGRQESAECLGFAPHPQPWLNYLNMRHSISGSSAGEQWQRVMLCHHGCGSVGSRALQVHL